MTEFSLNRLMINRGREGGGREGGCLELQSHPVSREIMTYGPSNTFLRLPETHLCCFGLPVTVETHMCPFFIIFSLTESIHYIVCVRLWLKDVKD